MNEKVLDPKEVKLSNYALDTFIAPKLSQLKKCNAPDLSNLKNEWLNNFILNSIFRIKVLDTKKAHIFNFLRRVEVLFNEYDNARKALNEYVSTERNTISPYFRALIHFETFFAQLHQAILFLEKIAELEIYKRGDNSPKDVVRKIYNTSKHMDEKINKGKLPEKATISVWITNDGIESNNAKITFTELKDILIELSNLANKISNPTLK